MLTERLDHHRGRGQQQIVVKHVTVNADQALVADTVVTGKDNESLTAAKLVAASADKPMEIVEPMQKNAVPVGGGSKAKLASTPCTRRHAAALGQSGAACRVVRPRFEAGKSAGCTVLEVGRRKAK
jgi:hypothetical protein